MKHFLNSSLFLLCALATVVVGQNCNHCQGCCYLTVNSTALCKCDQHCQEFSDCCGNSSSDTASTLLLSNSRFQCISVYTDQDFPVFDENKAFLMIPSCKSSWTNTEDNVIERNCNIPTQPLPPVTDITTGLVYRNEYCARCNGVLQVVAWSSQLVCNKVIHDLITNSTLAMAIDRDPDLLKRECNICSFIPPNIIYNRISAPRSCIPRVETCLPQHQMEMKTNKTIEEDDHVIQVQRCRSSRSCLQHS